MEFPDLRESDVKNCRLLIDRDRILRHLPRNGIVAEVGVAIGGFSEKILHTLKPKRFFAVDTFGIPRDGMLWGRPTNEVFGDKDHYGFYVEKFRKQVEAGILHVEKGLSWEVLSRFPDRSFDVIYIDAAHDYDSVGRDAREAVKKLKSSGTIIFNDYIMYDHLGDVEYGVIPVVHELCVNEGFEMKYFALQKHMFCDVALHRRTRNWKTMGVRRTVGAVGRHWRGRSVPRRSVPGSAAAARMV